MPDLIEAESADAFRLAVRVYFQDTDAGGVVFHANYLNFFERARTEWLRQLGFDIRRLAEEEGMLFIVRELEAKYWKPARLDDLLSVTAGVARIGRAQFTLRQRVLRGDESLVEAFVNLACVESGSLKPMRLPQSLLATLGARAPRDCLSIIVEDQQ